MHGSKSCHGGSEEQLLILVGRKWPLDKLAAEDHMQSSCQPSGPREVQPGKGGEGHRGARDSRSREEGMRGRLQEREENLSKGGLRSAALR